jgi:hypothetical protein
MVARTRLDVTLNVHAAAACKFLALSQHPT